jgi:hypothetical protein
MSNKRQLQKIVQNSVAAEEVWRAQDINLASLPRQEATAFMPYTTCIYIAQMDNKLSLSAKYKKTCSCCLKANGGYRCKLCDQREVYLTKAKGSNISLLDLLASVSHNQHLAITRHYNYI